MDILEEIRTAISTFDPELAKNEDDGVESSDEEDKDINQDNYQDAIDSAVDPEDLNFSMDPLFDGDDDEEEEEVEQINIPQKDYEENPIQVDDVVKKVTRDDLTGKVLAVGELVEVEWTPDLITLEYPEELIHAEDEEEEDQKLNSLAENPPLPVESPNV